MSNELNPKPDSSEPMVYQVRIKGHLNHQGSEWFDGLTPHWTRMATLYALAGTRAIRKMVSTWLILFASRVAELLHLQGVLKSPPGGKQLLLVIIS